MGGVRFDIFDNFHSFKKNKETDVRMDERSDGALLELLKRDEERRASGISWLGG